MMGIERSKGVDRERLQKERNGRGRAQRMKGKEWRQQEGGERTRKKRSRGKREDVERGVWRHGELKMLELGGLSFLLAGSGTLLVTKRCFGAGGSL